MGTERFAARWGRRFSRSSGQTSGSGPETGFEEVGQIGNEKSASVYYSAASLGLKPPYRPKPVVGLPTQIANDKGRLLQ